MGTGSDFNLDVLMGETSESDEASSVAAAETGVDESADQQAADVDDDSAVSADDNADNAAEGDELTALREQVRLLTEQVNSAYQIPSATKEQEVAEEPIVALDASKLFGQWTYDDIVENEDSFKKFMTEFATNLTTATEERLLKKLPFTVSKLTSEQIEARQTVQEFYDEHPQLAAVKPFVAKLVSTVAAEQADWDLPQVLAESATRAYAALGLKQQATTPPAAPSKRPAFAGPASSKRGAVPQGKSKLESEIDELLALDL